jgi:putative acetyltransferase
MNGRDLMGQALPKPALRPYLAEDLPVIVQIFTAAIEELAAEDYGEAQLAAWAAQADEGAVATRLAGQLTLVATLEHSPVGFASLRGNEAIDMLYVHPGAARQGVATMLVDALEKLAAARGAERLSVDASDTAAPLFEKRGYTPERRNTVAVGGEWLGNTSMHKVLTRSTRSAQP